MEFSKQPAQQDKCIRTVCFHLFFLPKENIYPDIEVQFGAFSSQEQMSVQKAGLGVHLGELKLVILHSLAPLSPHFSLLNEQQHPS